MDEFIERSNQRQWSIVGVGLAILVAIVLLAGGNFYSMQQSNIAQQKVQEAVGHARDLLKQLKISWNRGDITLNGAEAMLEVAAGIIGIVGSTATPAKDLGPLIELGLASSDLQGDFGQYKKAEESATAVRNLAEQLRKAKPKDKEALKLLYGSIWHVADSEVQLGESEKALGEYEEAKKLALQVKELPPPNGADDRELMFIYLKIGDFHITKNEYNTAEVEYRTAWEAIQRALKAVPDDRNFQLDAANTRRRLAGALVGEQKFIDASEQFKIAIADLSKLAKQAEDDETGWSNLAAAHREFGEFHARQRDLDRALAEYREAMEIQKRQNEKDPSNATWIAPLANTYRKFGMILRQKGKSKEAVKYYENVQVFREQLFNRDRVNRLRQKALAIANIDLADVKTELARKPEEEAREQDLDMAARLYRSAIDIFDEFRPKEDANVFDCYIKIGDIHMLQNNPDDALEGFKAASGIALENTNRERGVRWQGRLASSYVKIGDALVAQGLLDRAITEYERALRITTALAELYPQSPEWTFKKEELNKKIQILASGAYQ